MIGETAPSLWCSIADTLVLPRERRRGAIINHDGAKLTELQGGVPESAAGLFPVGYRASATEELTPPVSLSSREPPEGLMLIATSMRPR